jgi:hypothetical protein
MLYMVVSLCMGSQDTYVAALSVHVRKALIRGLLEHTMYRVSSSMTTVISYVASQFVPRCTWLYHLVWVHRTLM